MDQSGRSSIKVKRGKKACTECRQQKAKCDAYLDPNQPCSRCRKVKSRCIVSDPFKREHKRQRLSELEHETDELRRRLGSSNHVSHQPSPIALLTAAAEMRAHLTINGQDMHISPLPQTRSISPYSQHALSPMCFNTTTKRAERSTDSTASQTLNGITISGEEIEDMFQLFFHRYAQFLPILDPQISPNSYYAQSPFLFWAIIGAACRTYPKNPTLLSALARSITELALLSIVSVSVPWHTIQGLLINLTWPFPKDSARPDVTFPLCGMLLHIAMQNGLHIPMSSHEFSRVKVPAPSEGDMIRRSELWAHCVIVYQRACIAKGQSARTLVNLEQDPGQNQLLLQKIAPSLVLRVKSQELIARCSAAALENGVRSMSVEQERSLDILLRGFETQMSDLEARTMSDYDNLHTTLCRLSVQVFHFYKTQTILATDCLSRVLSTACALVDSVSALNERLGVLATAPVQVNSGLLLAAISLLRILKIFGPRGLDIERAKSCFFAAINLAKKMSVESNDSPAKTVVILNQLWNSSKAFRKTDGSEYTALRIRSRLVLSPVVDAIWWWRDEFDPQARAMISPQGEQSGADISRESQGTAILPLVGPAERQEPLHFDDQFLADFEWALGDDGIFHSAEPYSSIWPSAGDLV